jgi:hypothetical protein
MIRYDDGRKRKTIRFPQDPRRINLNKASKRGAQIAAELGMK